MGFQRLRGSLLAGIVAADEVAAVDAHVNTCRLGDALPAVHDPLNLPQLHAIAPDLDHPVVAPVEEQIPVRIPGHPVACVIKARAGAEGVGCETPRRLLRHVVVAQREPGAGHAELADGFGLCDEFSVLVQQIRTDSGARLSQGKRTALSHRMV